MVLIPEDVPNLRRIHEAAMMVRTLYSKYVSSQTHAVVCLLHLQFQFTFSFSAHHNWEVAASESGFHYFMSKGFRVMLSCVQEEIFFWITAAWWLVFGMSVCAGSFSQIKEKGRRWMLGFAICLFSSPNRSDGLWPRLQMVWNLPLPFSSFG